MKISEMLHRALLGAALAAALVSQAAAQGAYPGSGPQPVSRGATGRASLTQNNLIFGNGTSPVGFIAPGTSGRCLVDNGTIWTPGYCVTSSGAAVTGTTGHAVPFLDGANTWTATQSFPAGSIPNATLANPGLTLGSTALTLGATTTNVAGLTLTTPTLNFATGSTNYMVASSTNTGFQNNFDVANAGTLSNAATQANVIANLTAGSGTFVQLGASGGATPSGSLTSQFGLTGGLTISAAAGPLNITNPILSTPNIGVATGTSLVLSGALSAGGNILGGGVIETGTTSSSYLYVVPNSSGTFPVPGNGGAIGWNFASGVAEVDFWNTFTSSVPSASFAWRQQLTASTQNNLMQLLSNGSLNVLGTAASTSPTNGALTVVGGAGIDGALNVGGALGFPNNSLTLAEFPSIGADTVIGSIAGGTPIALSQAQLTSLINPFTPSLNGGVTAPGTPTGRFLGDDGGWHSAGGSGTVTSVACNGLTITGTGSCPEAFGFANCTLAASVSGNALTIALKDNSGADPSATSPCRISFRNVTPTTGTPALVSVTAALSVTVPSGQTLGTSNNVPFRFWVEAINNGGTVALVVYNASAGGTIFPLPEANLISTSAIATAPSAGVFYSTSALSSLAFSTLGYIQYSSGLTTAGTYASAPTDIQTYRAGIKKPGEVVQIGPTGTLTTQATITMPATPAYTSTGLSTTITPTSKVNYVSCQVSGVGGPVTVNDTGYFQIVRGGVNVGLGHQMFAAAADFFIDLNLSGIDAPGSTASLTYTLFTQIPTASHNIIFPASSGVISNIGASIGCSELQG